MTASGHLDRAAAGFARGDRYERARPGYPPEAVEALVAALDVASGGTVVDLAAGTGKLTRELVARGLDVVAVEPVAGMRTTLSAKLPGVRVLEGRAEAIPLPGGTAAAVTVAQAFHWFDGPRALREIHRILRPGGMLGLMWNVMDRSVPWVDRLQEAIHTHRGEHPWYTGHRWREAFDTLPTFEPLHHVAFANAQVVDRAGLHDRVRSVSFVGTLPERERRALAAQVDDIVDGADLLAAGATFAVPYVTDVFWCRRDRAGTRSD